LIFLTAKVILLAITYKYIYDHAFLEGEGNIKSLSRKFFWILFLGVIFFFGLLTYLILQREKAIIFSLYKEQSLRAVNVIAQDITHMMLNSNPDAVKDNIAILNNTRTMRVGVVGPRGTPAFGTDLPVAEDIFRMQNDYYVVSTKELTFYRPIANDTRCHHCHFAEDKKRGMIVIKTSMAEAEAEISETARRLVIFAFILGLTSEGFLMLVLRNKILNPLGVLHRGAQSWKAGRFDHRIELRSDDEIGTLASCFNDMAESIEKSHSTLEYMVRARTSELRVIAELSTEVFKGDLTLPAIIERFLRAMTDELGYGYASLCLVDRETGILSREFKRGIGEGFCAMEISLASEHPLTKTIREALPSIRRAADVGAPSSHADVAVVPILSHQRRKCREINLCAYESCPAYFSTDDRCWLIDDTRCRSPQSVAGQNKIFGCLHCPAFPVLGVLITGREGEIGTASLHSLEILASELASAIENQKFIEAKKEDIARLIRLHDVSVESLQNPEGGLENTIVSSAQAFSNTNAAILWLLRNDGMLHPVDSFGIDPGLLPSPIPADTTFVGRAMTGEGAVETVEMQEVKCMEGLIKEYGFLYAASVPLKFKDTVFGCLSLFKKSDFLMSDSEKAVTLLFASQAAAAMNTSRIYDELKAEKEFSDAIFSCASSGIMVLDREGRVLKMNNIGAEILQVEVSRAVGRKITEIYPETEEMLSVDPGLSREISISLPSGEELPIGFANSRLFDPNDVKEGVVVLFKNLTEIKRLQSEVRKKEHFATMTKVISGVAHEIRNPLFGISSIGQILERELDSPQHKALAQAMLKESDRMKRLVEELLLYTKPSRLDKKEVDLGILCEELGYYLKAKRENLALSLNIPPLTVLMADKDKITQVFLNLLNNAIDAASHEISVSAKTADGRIEIRISDDGPGIKEQDLGKVFDPFFTTKKGGTGLGLPICKRIVEDHGGTIEIIDEDGRGTTVVLVFGR
jgi:signal transduction histidine kinase/HAMP domain-containing protein